jgi:hypothetical protein
MVSLAIVAALSAIGTAGMRQHLAHAKSAEAMHSVGGIGRTVAASHANWNTPDPPKQAPGKGKPKAPKVVYASGICADAAPVPGTFESVKNRKYQPDNSPGRDYQTGDTAVGWRCLGYQNDEAQHYQLGYKLGAPPIAVRSPNGGAPPGIAVTSRWSAYARGDVDGDGIQSWFILNGYIHKDEIVIASSLSIIDQDE